VTKRSPNAEDLERTLDASFGAMLRKLREERGLSQEQLAFETGVHRTFVSQLERGLKTPSLATLFKLAAALGIEPSKMIRKLEAQSNG
jgi:transcriptional regulator with XRE-family HTH domain